MSASEPVNVIVLGAVGAVGDGQPVFAAQGESALGCGERHRQRTSVVVQFGQGDGVSGALRKHDRLGSDAVLFAGHDIIRRLVRRLEVARRNDFAGLTGAGPFQLGICRLPRRLLIVHAERIRLSGHQVDRARVGVGAGVVQVIDQQLRR